MESFFESLASLQDEQSILDFCRRRSLHGTPVVFAGDEDAYYSFRKRIADEFEISFHEIYITGSAKLGFSPFKRKQFDLESDIDVALVSSKLYDRIMDSIHEYQMALRGHRKAVSEGELRNYHRFLEYGAIGWMRPDLLPSSFRVKELKDSWFDFFESISYGRSEVGNYKVNAGAFKSYAHLEKYALSGIKSLVVKSKIEVLNVRAD